MHNQTVFIGLAVLACLIIGALICDMFWRAKNVRDIVQSRRNAQAECNESAERGAAILGEQSKQYHAMKEDVDQIALCLRDQYASEIKQGFHGGRSLGAIVVGYLNREREQSRVMRENSQLRSAVATAITDELNNKNR